jgi:hypothetical protein
MNTAKLIEELRSRGVLLEAAGDRIRVDAPKGALTPELRLVLTDRKLEIIALLKSGDTEIAWRTAAMLPQIPEKGPLPFLLAREAVEPQAGCCLSCGDPLNQDDAYRCAPCSRAANLAIEMAVSLKTATRNGGRVD